VEGNRILHVSTGGPYHDTFHSRGGICRENWYQDIFYGTFENLNVHSVSQWFGGVELESLTHDGNTATAITQGGKPHGFWEGDLVEILEADDELYNGQFLITAVPNASTFIYTMSGIPDEDASGARFRGAG